MSYEMLLSPMKIGTMTVKNRTVMTAAEFSLGQTDGTPTEKLMDYYEERAIGGVGMITPGICRVDLHAAFHEPRLPHRAHARVRRAHTPSRRKALHPAAPPRASGLFELDKLAADAHPHREALPQGARYAV